MKDSIKEHFHSRIHFKNESLILIDLGLKNYLEVSLEQYCVLEYIVKCFLSGSTLNISASSSYLQIDRKTFYNTLNSVGLRNSSPDEQKELKKNLAEFFDNAIKLYEVLNKLNESTVETSSLYKIIGLGENDTINKYYAG